MRDRDVRLLLSAQTLVPGGGGVGAVAKLTLLALGDHFPIRVLACQDRGSYTVRSAPVRGFSARRVPFATANFIGVRRATHVIYDHPGTARAHLNLPLGRRPYAVWVHGWEVWGEPRADYLRAIRRADLVLANSAYTVERAGRALAESNVRVCELGTFADTAPAAAPQDGPPTVMLLGRADELFAKGHDLLIEVWPKVASAVPGARLVLAGGGTAVDKVRRLAATSAVHDAIEVTGFVPDDRLEAYWQRASVFAMPGYAEGFGLVYIEAMRRAIPVVAATDDAGGVINVDGVTGLNIPRADKDRLAEILIHLLSDRDYAARLGRAGQDRWRGRFAFSQVKARLLETTAGFFGAS